LKQRDFSIERLDQLVDEFDAFERAYFENDADQQSVAEHAYPMLVDEQREERIRIPYTFAAVLGMTPDPELREEIARKEGHIPDDAPEWAIEDALGRVERARNWARRTGNAFDYELKRQEMPNVAFDEGTQTALDELAAFIEKDHGGDEIQQEIYDTAKRHDIEISDLFSAGYQLFFDDTEGPQLGPFLGKLDRDFVVARLRRER
jgi:lysyl-tRNA synthetase class 1